MQQPSQPPYRPRVLLLEDDADVRQLMTVVLTRAGYDVAVAARRSEAAALVGGHTFEAAVLDICLPDGRGDDIAALLREQAPDTRVVMTSAVAHTSLVPQAAEAGDIFLLKPFSNSALIAAVSAHSATPG